MNKAICFKCPHLTKEHALCLKRVREKIKRTETVNTIRNSDSVINDIHFTVPSTCEYLLEHLIDE